MSNPIIIRIGLKVDTVGNWCDHFRISKAYVYSYRRRDNSSMADALYKVATMKGHRIDHNMIEELPHTLTKPSQAEIITDPEEIERMRTDRYNITYWLQATSHSGTYISEYNVSHQHIRMLKATGQVTDMEVKQCKSRT